MANVFGLVALLVVMAGVIAYLGDRLGTLVGRRRLSLFGARPRKTGQIVGVLAGILIMLVTLGVLALAFQNAAQTLVNAQRTADELNRLRAQERVQQNRVDDLTGQLAQIQAQLQQAQTTISTAQAARDQALQERDAAQQERDALQAQVKDLNASAEAVKQQLTDATSALQATRTELETVQTDLGQARSERDQAQAEAAKAVQDAAAARDQAQALQDQVKTVQEQLDGANAQLEQLQGQLASTQASLADAQQELDTAQADLDTARSARDEAQTARDQALQERDQAQQEAEALKQQTTDLQSQVGQLQGEVSDLEAQQGRLAEQAAALADQNEALQTRNARLSEENQAYVQRNEALSQQSQVLQQQIQESNTQIRQLQEQAQTLNDKLEAQATRLADLQSQYERAATGDVYFQKDQLIYSGAIYAQDPAAIKDELAKFVNDATAFVSRRGVERIRLTSEQFNSLVDVISQTPGSDLVRLISPTNQYSSVVDVSVEALENTQLFDQGQLIVSRQIHLGSPDLPASQDELRNSLAQLKRDALVKMRRAGLDEMQLPDYGQVSEETFTNLLLRLDGPVTIGLVATEPVFRAGPARLELMILY